MHHHKSELFDALKAHDWYYMMSDDHGVWNRGRKSSDVINKQMTKLDCPYTMGDLHRFVSDSILEDHQIQPDGKYRKAEWMKVVASRDRRDLITREEAAAMQKWFDA